MKSTPEMKSTPRKRIVILGVTAFAALLVMACSATPASETSAPTATVVASPAPEVTVTPASAAEPTAEAATETPTEETVAETPTPVEEAVIVVENTKINLNSFTADEVLNTIPGFSQRFVREFFEYQPYISIQQFRREMGKYVDDSQIATWEGYVYVPVNVDESDAATLMQIPGLDEAAATQLLEARPYGSTDAFLQKLAEIAPGVDASVAAGYLAQ